MRFITFLLLASQTIACPTGTISYEGICASDLAPSQADPTIIDSATKPSDEKPPRNPIPAYERGDVKANIDIRPSTGEAAQDYKSEKEQK